MPPHPLLSTYYLSNNRKAGGSCSFPSWEMIGQIKTTPEDFIVREIFSHQDKKQIPCVDTNNPPTVAEILAYEALPKQHLLEEETPKADDEDPNPSKTSTAKITNDSTNTTTTTTSNKGENETGAANESMDVEQSKEDPLGQVKEEKEKSPLKVMEEYLKKAFLSCETSQETAAATISSLQKLHKAARERIQTIAKEKRMVMVDDSPKEQQQTESEVVLIPPPPSNESAPREQRRALHKALKAEFPLLRAQHTVKNKDEVKDSTNNNNGGHWIQVMVNDIYDDLIPYLFCPQEDLHALLVFQNRGLEGWIMGSPSQTGRDRKGRQRKQQNHRGNRASTNNNEGCGNNQVILRLRPEITKDERRSIHQLIALKCKQFETGTIPDFPLQQQLHQMSNDRKDTEVEKSSKEKYPEEDSATTAATTTALVVSWQRQAIERARFNRKRKRFNAMNNDDDSKQPSTLSDAYPNVLFVMKKRQKEHMTALQKLAQAIRCRQSDIGIAGIKDLQAITYQFCTVRNIGSRRVQKANKQLSYHGIELGNFYQVDWVLNHGDLEGNQFEITVRNLKRVHVQLIDNEAAKETWIPCDPDHLQSMVTRLLEHGFINFFGSQRVGEPGSTEEAGVRAFDIGRAMLQHKFSLAIDLIMTGRSSSRESKKVRQVRKVWKESNGDATLTLKAFQGADMMPRERAVLKGLNRYGKDQPLEALRCLSYSMRTFWINAFQSFVWNTVVSKRFQKYGNQVIEGDLYFDGSNNGEEVKVVNESNIKTVYLSHVVHPLPGHNVRYPENDIGGMYRDLLEQEEIKFEKSGPSEATAKGSYRRIVVKPRNLKFEKVDPSSSSGDVVKLLFQLPKGSYATMFLRELMLTTATRSGNNSDNNNNNNNN